MAQMAVSPRRSTQAGPKGIYDKDVQAVIWQVVVLSIVAGIGYYLYSNMQYNLQTRQIKTGYDFLGTEAGFGIGEAWVAYSPASSYAHALFVGFLNTIAVALLGVVAATILGISVGVATLSRNWLVAKLTGSYIHFLRNIPVLLQIILWHTLITNERFLPLPRDFNAENSTLSPILGQLYVTRRGLFFPWPDPHWGWGIAGIGLIIGLLAAWLISRWATARRELTGEPFPAFWTGVGAVIACIIVGWILGGAPTGISMPSIGRFQVSGGATITPEFMAVLFGLTVYTSAFIADIVRSGILSVSKGQIEAGRALGLRESIIMRKVILPQALRVIIPPLTSQYLNLTKNSSLAVAVGYPDLVNIGNTTMNQTGQAPELIMIMMAVYLTISICTALFMNWYNTQIQLVER